MQKSSILDVWESSKYASEVASNVNKVIDKLLLEKAKKKEPSKLEKSWTKMLLNKTNSFIFKSCIAQSNISWYPWYVSKNISRGFALRLTQRHRKLFLYTLYMPCFFDGTW